MRVEIFTGLVALAAISYGQSAYSNCAIKQPANRSVVGSLAGSGEPDGAKTRTALDDAHGTPRAPCAKSLPSTTITVSPQQKPLPSKDPMARPEPSAQPAKSLAGEGAQQITTTGAENSEQKAEAAATQARDEHAITDFERDLARNIAKDFDAVSAVVLPLLKSTDTEKLSEGRRFLNRSTIPPKEFAEFYKLVKLNTNRDVYQKGERYVKNLARASEAHSLLANELEQSSQQATAAAERMREFSGTLSDRSDKLNSVSGEKILSGGTTGVKMDAALSRDKGAYDADLKAIPKQDSTESTSNSIGTRELRESKSVVDPSKTSDQGPSNLATAAKGNKSPIKNSLSDKLRRALAQNNQPNAAADTKGNRIPASASGFSKIFETDESSAVEHEESFSAADPKAVSFRMSQADTDVAVKKLIKNLNDANGIPSEREIYGNSEITIFARMKNCLTKAQTDRRL